MNILKNLIFLEFLILNMVLHPSSVNAFNCNLPEGCRIENLYNSDFNAVPQMMCNVNEKFEFTFKGPTPLFKSDEKCYFGYIEFLDLNAGIFWKNSIIFRGIFSSNELNILEKRFNFTNLMRYLSFFTPEVFINFWGLKGFDVKFLGENYNISEYSSINQISLSDCRLNFYHNKKKINSCQNFIDWNITQISSIFQIRFSANDIANGINLVNIKYKEKICPLVFKNTKFQKLLLNGLVDSFYKKNVITFSNETYPQLNSTIKFVDLEDFNNINIDLNLLHNSVFYNMISLGIESGFLNSINGDFLKHFPNFTALRIHPNIFKKINHKQGIEWIRQMNFGINVNLSKEPSQEDFKHYLSKKKLIMLSRITKYNHISLKLIFPDEDFCIYVDFPFNQIVIVYEIFLLMAMGTRNFTTELSCTYLWLVQYYEYYNKYIIRDATFDYLNTVLNSTAFISMSKCNFEERISRCNKSKFQPKNIWDESDFFILNKKVQTAFKISLYPISLLGLITNFIVVLVILKKDNSDLFKEFKQYNYLYINSIFCMMISVIELLSWMTECFYPFEVFCPEIRKLVAIQFFKIIFKECFVTVFRFMCNFTYIAFALNRISLIGKDHGKIVTFMSKVGIKKYIGVSFLISSFFSWIKGFKYEVNYFYPDFNFPMFNQVSKAQKSTYNYTFKHVFFTFTVISDLVNYFVFVVISVIIDICMVVQLRRTLDEKLKKSQSLNQKQNESKKAESEEAVNKAIQMVVLNSVIGIFFKLPICIIPLINIVAQFYYKNHNNLYYNINFDEFFQYLYDSEFYDLIQDISYFLFNFALSIQMFIYYRFDKKFLTGFQRIKDKAFTYIKSLFKSKSNS